MGCPASSVPPLLSRRRLNTGAPSERGAPVSQELLPPITLGELDPEDRSLFCNRLITQPDRASDLSALSFSLAEGVHRPGREARVPPSSLLRYSR